MRLSSRLCPSVRRRHLQQRMLSFTFIMTTAVGNGCIPRAGAQEVRLPFHTHKGFRATLSSTSGLVVTTYQTPQGKILVYFPADLHPSESVVGTVRLQPKGKEEAERTTNRAALAAYHLAWGTQVHPVQEVPLIWTLPATTSAAADTLILEDAQDQPLVQADLSSAVPPSTSNSAPATSSTAPQDKFVLPKRGTIGRPLVLSGNVGEEALAYQVQVGDKPARLLAASSHTLIVESPEGVVGKTTLKLQKADQVVAASAFRNDRVSHNFNPWPYIIVGAVAVGVAIAVIADNLRHDINNSLNNIHYPF
jgi:hypothetical protein